MRFFKKTEKTLIRRVSDRVNNSMSVYDCYSFIRGAYKAELDLHFIPGDHEWKDTEARHEKKERDDEYTKSYYQPILDYSQELVDREINSTEAREKLERDMQPMKDEIISYIVKEYTFESTEMYDTQRVIDKYVDNSKMNITMLPEVVWSTTWHPNHKEVKKLYNKYSQH